MQLLIKTRSGSNNQAMTRLMLPNFWKMAHFLFHVAGDQLWGVTFLQKGRHQEILEVLGFPFFKLKKKKIKKIIKKKKQSNHVWEDADTA